MTIQYNHTIDLTSFNYLANLSEVSVETSLYRKQALPNTGPKIHPCCTAISVPGKTT
jgi:hypothetical protein